MIITSALIQIASIFPTEHALKIIAAQTDPAVCTASKRLAF